MSPCRLGGGTPSHTQWGPQVWRFPLTARSAVAEALEAAVGVRCTVEDVHPVPKAYLEVCHVALGHESFASGLNAPVNEHGNVLLGRI